MTDPDDTRHNKSARQPVRCATPYLRMTEDEKLHGRLRVAVNEGAVVVRVNETRLNAPGSPAHSNLDNLLLLGVIICGIVVSFWHFGGWIGLGSLILWAVVYQGGAGYILGRVNARACRLALASDAHLDELWKWGGLILQTADGAAVAKPGDGWRSFAREHCRNVPLFSSRVKTQLTC